MTIVAMSRLTQSHLFLLYVFLLTILLASCLPPQTAGSGQATVSAQPTPAPMLTSTPAPTATPEPTPTPTPLPPEFLTQFEGTAYVFKEGQVLFFPAGDGATPEETQASPIAEVKNGKFTFTVSGKEVAVDPARLEILSKEWFLNGEAEQIVAVKDESGSWWQYEFDRQSGGWVEKSLPEVSTDVMQPTRLEWNDIIGNRWATAVRREIEAGNIPTFDPQKLKDVRFELQDDEWFKEYGMRKATPNLWAPDYLDLREPGSFPIIYSAYGVMEVEGGKIGILTEQIATDKNGNFVLFNLYGPPEDIQHDVTYGRRDWDNVRSYFTPIVERNKKGCESWTYYPVVKNLCEKWEVPVSDMVREAARKWVNGEVFEPIFERVILAAGPTAYGD